ncbi:MAG: uroporphyrinogen-III C-methyltransferase [Hyphomicrobiaceae bacterium]
MTQATNNNDNTADNVAPIPLPGVANRRMRHRQPHDFHVVFEAGWVWLTGAGPGDPGLLTLHAMQAIRDADLIYYDALVSEEILELVPPETEIIYVGKRGGWASPKQSEITERLIQSARAGRKVLRLKGGDPFVFGRGAEEAQELTKAGIPFRILPGVTAGIGGLAYAGIPVSHRDFNQAVTLITAHDASGGLSQGIDWNAVSRGSPVLVIYMGFRLLGTIAERLIAEGRRADEPVAIVCHATMPEQQTVVTTLEHAARDAEAAGLGSPAMIVVGEIVRLGEELEWLTSLAELGHTCHHAATGT